MSISLSRAVVACASAVCLFGGVLLAIGGSASAALGFEFDRIAGADRFETSALVAAEVGDGANAILANGQEGQFADALAANYLAGDLDAPVYLTRKNFTPDSILDQLEANGVQSITVVGGDAAVAQAQVGALEDAGYDVSRISGPNRFETNADIIDAVGDAPEDTALVATGLNFTDALASGPLAERGHPIALASQSGVSDEVLGALDDAGVESAIIVGGESAVGAGAVNDLDAAGIDVVTRLAGDGRADTSVAVAEYAVENLGLTDTGVNIASGDADGTGADALSGGVLTGRQGRPLLVTQSVNNPSDAVRTYVEENADTLTGGIIFGGESAVSDAAQAELEEAGQGEPVTPPPNPPTNPPTDPDPGSEEGLEITSPADGELVQTGSPVTVDAFVTDDDGVPVEDGTLVEFVVDAEVDGDNALSAIDETEDGVATFTYRRLDGEGEDVITASTDGEDADPDLDLVDEVTIEFVDELSEAPVVLNPEDGPRYFRQIGDAIDAAVDGDDITATGRFEENVDVDKSVTLTGTDATIVGRLDVDNGRPEDNDGLRGGEGAVIDGFTIEYDDFFTTSFILAPDVTLTNLVYGGARAIFIDGTGVSVTDSTFAANRRAISVNAEDSVITNNEFSTNRPVSTVYVEYTLPEPLTEQELNDVLTANGPYDPNALVDQGRQWIRAIMSPRLEDPTVEDLGDTSVILTIQESTLEEGDNSIEIRGEAGNPTDPADVGTDSQVFATAATDADAEEPGFQVLIDDLQPRTAYFFAARQTVDGVESNLGNQVGATTVASGAQSLTIMSAVKTVGSTFLNDGDEWELTLSEPIRDDLNDGVVDRAAPDEDATRFALQATNGGSFTVQCGLTANDPGVLTAATCETAIDDASLDDDELRITLPFEPTTTSGPYPNYPLGIVGVDNLTATTGAAEVDLAGSADTSID